MNTKTDPRIKETYLYKKLENSKVQCLTCNRFCIIEEGELGYCKVRLNHSGKLYSIEYSDISSYNLNPIEKKPAYHYYPTSTALTLGSWGCNFPCEFCQNFEISKRPPPQDFFNSSLLSVEKVVETIRTNPGIQGISFSFNEPTLSLEYTIDVFKSVDPTYYKHYVTNGYMSPYALNLLIDSGMDGITVSFKGLSKKIEQELDIKLDKIWKNVKSAYQSGVHVEIVYLVIPGISDKREQIIKFVDKIQENLSVYTPVHFIRYFPHYLYEIPATPIDTLQKVHSIAKNKGLKYAYLGNVPGHPLQNTFCPNCSELLVRRDLMSVTYTNLTVDLKCPNCLEEIPIYPYRRVSEIKNKE